MVPAQTAKTSAFNLTKCSVNLVSETNTLTMTWTETSVDVPSNEPLKPGKGSTWLLHETGEVSNQNTRRQALHVGGHAVPRAQLPD